MTERSQAPQTAERVALPAPRQAPLTGAPAPVPPDLAAALHAAPRNGSLALRYQPEVDLATGEIVAMEALVRWHRPGEGEVLPGTFLPLAAACGAGPAFAEWVLQTAAAEAARWASLPGPVHELRVNVSPEELCAPGFVERVAALVAQHGLAAGALGLEVTEPALTALNGRATAVLTQLAQAGVGVAVDDFGTWYAALAHLAELPVSVVKLDRHFVQGVGGELRDDRVVESLIALAHARGLLVVAEGVESWTEGARLTELGCDRAHGYLYASPQRADRARWLLSQGSGWRGETVPMPTHPSGADRA